MEGITPHLEKTDILLYENGRADLTERLQQVAAKTADVRPIDIMISEGRIFGKLSRERLGADAAWYLQIE